MIALSVLPAGSGTGAQTLSAADAAHAVHAAAGEADVPTASLQEAVLTDGGTFNIRLSTSPHPLRLNEYFELIVEIRSLDEPGNDSPLRASVNARMPGHEHGMNTRPRRLELEDGQFVFAGMLFHMAGEWEVELDVGRGRIHEKANARLTLE
jgi:hypothetical protein